MSSIVLHVITDFNQGGAQSALYRFLCKSKNEFRNVVICLGSANFYGQRLHEQSIEVYEFNLNVRYLRISTLIRLYKLIKHLNPDVVQTWLYHADLVGGVLARIAGYRVFWGIHNFNLHPNGASFSTRLVAKICSKLSWHLPEAISTVSFNSIATHRTYGYDPSRFKVIHLGYDLVDLKFNLSVRGSFLQNNSLAEDTFIIGCVARWDPQKDHSSLLKAFGLFSKRVSNVQCILVGSQISFDNQDLMKLILLHGISLESIKIIDQTSRIQDVMSILDIHVLSSIGEAFPNVVAEAMACEVPCIVTDVGDSTLIVGDTGWVVPHSCPEELVAAMEVAYLSSLNHEDWSKRKGECRKRIIENFSIEKMVENYRELWSLNS